MRPKWDREDYRGERPLPIAGPGSPLVTEFAATELAAVLGWTYEGSCSLMADALDLAHRLPRLWRLVRAGRLPAHLARLAAQESRDLSPAAAAHADRLLCWQASKLNPHRTKRLVEEARLYVDPDQARAAEEEALEKRKVEVRHGLGAPGASDVWTTLETPGTATSTTSNPTCR